MLDLKSFKVLNIPILKIFCKNVGIKCSKLKKEELFNSFNQVLACKIIQRHFRNYFYKNAEDSISLEPVKYPCFVYCTKFRKCFFYSYDTIIKYIMKTGDTRDPMTRNVYSDTDLSRLDAEAKQHFPEIKYSSTLKIKKNINYAKRIRNRENEILSYQTYLEELKNKLIIVIESDALSWDIIDEITIDSAEYTSIIDYINMLLEKIKIVYRSLNAFDVFSAQCFKTNILLSIESFDTQIIQLQFILEYIYSF